MYEIGISSCNKTIDRALFKDYSENEIKHIEISEASYDGFDYKNVYSLAKEFSVNLWSLHLPFFPFDRFDISSLDHALRQATIAEFSEIIKKGADIGIDKFIIHPSGEPIENGEREERKKYSRATLSVIADICSHNGATLCVEDLPRSCIGHSIDEMRFLTSEDDRLKICFDTNHITTENPEDIIDALGDKIITLHVSDFDFINERHWLPGEGKINWKKVMNSLKRIQYSGAFMYEIGFKCPATILRDRDLTAADFNKNAHELFEDKILTVYSKQKPNLGFWE